jgi:hypothetical protein
MVFCYELLSSTIVVYESMYKSRWLPDHKSSPIEYTLTSTHLTTLVCTVTAIWSGKYSETKTI